MLGQNLYLNVLGNNEKETAVIDSLGYFSSHKDLKSITQELDSLNNKLYRLGYIDAKSNKPIKENDSTFLATINLKNRFYSILIYYDNAVVDESLLRRITTNKTPTHFTIPFTRVEYTLNYLNNTIAEQGKPFNKVRLKDILKINQNTLSATLDVYTENSNRRIDDIVIKGYEKFPKSFIKHYLKIKEGQVFKINTLKEKTKNLGELTFASEIKPPEVLFTQDSTTLYLYVEKNKSNTFDGYLGFGTNEDTNNIEFDGYLNLSLTNNLNYGESFTLQYKSDENDQKTFDAKLQLPYIFGTPIGTELELYLFKKDSSFTTATQSAKITYQVSSKHNVALGIKSTQSNNLQDSLITNTVSDYKSTFYNLAYRYTKKQPNNLLFRTKSQFYFESGLGSRETDLETEEQSTFTLDAFNIFYLNDRNSIYLRTNGNILNSSSYLENELFRFGGINSIRGFEENSLTASLFGLINTEYRYQLSQILYAHTITDLAYFENDITNTKEKLYGFGFGFGLITKAGLLRFIYANGKTENQPFRLSNSKIHISLSALF